METVSRFFGAVFVLQTIDVFNFIEDSQSDLNYFIVAV